MKDDAPWQRDEIESPCTKVCVIHPQERLCVGCYRSMDEIAAWSRMSPEARRGVMAALPDRAPRLAQRRGGRAARIARES
ncbi:DUF1289 domain-containing protein [Tropicimonas sediminicola]|uniref:DUF1289 domain-containing protein n=1 Tax=Tropicimonas sediminicola TaxID=1031541 RepID=A0A239D9V6_9RHOB|nr:DUF1289 domain-containing protein [Tropicimonas sediminicola]SNS28433.1 hypothetical protein SAMN05421757_101692 [Tropicimonas sediminicola]